MTNLSNAVSSPAPQTLLEIAGAKKQEIALKDSVVVVIDAQKEYTTGRLPLKGMDTAITQAKALLNKARNAGAAVIHVAHRGKAGGAFDPNSPSYSFIKGVEPIGTEAVVVKTLPNSFAGTDLEEQIKKTGKKHLILCGFMTHMCVSSTARAALDLGYFPYVVTDVVATRDLVSADGESIPAAQVGSVSLAELKDRFAWLVSVKELG